MCDDELIYQVGGIRCCTDNMKNCSRDAALYGEGSRVVCVMCEACEIGENSMEASNPHYCGMLIGH